MALLHRDGPMEVGRFVDLARIGSCNRRVHRPLRDRHVRRCRTQTRTQKGKVMKYFIIITAAVLAGCEQNLDKPPETFASEESVYKLCLIVDMSMSFDHLMAEQGRAREALLTVIDAYFRDRIGGSDKLILAQISAREPALIWEGTPQDLR